MIISKKTLEKIKTLIDKNYKTLLISTVGSGVLSKEELKGLKDQGIDVENKDSLLSMIYYNNILNDLTSTTGPTSIEDMRNQQKAKPSSKTYKAAEEHLNENFSQLVNALNENTKTKIEGLIRNFNMFYRNGTIKDPKRDEVVDKLVTESTKGGLKKAILGLSEEANREWERIVVTETANAIGLGSVDRVVSMNKNKPTNEIYVYRIPVNDAKLCKHCRKFYLDADGSPVVYRLSHLLSNGSNYGKKAIDWKPVALATHPNDRESGILELREGWKVVSEGKVEFIGKEKWAEYIKKKVRD